MSKSTNLCSELSRCCLSASVLSVCCCAANSPIPTPLPIHRYTCLNYRPQITTIKLTNCYTKNFLMWLTSTSKHISIPDIMTIGELLLTASSNIISREKRWRTARVFLLVTFDHQTTYAAFWYKWVRIKSGFIFLQTIKQPTLKHIRQPWQYDTQKTCNATRCAERLHGYQS